MEALWQAVSSGADPMPLVYCDRSIVNYERPEGIVVPIQPETQQSQAQRQVLGALRPSPPQREHASRVRKVNGELSTVLGPVALGVCPRSEAAEGAPRPTQDDRGGNTNGVSRGAMPFLPTPPSTPSEDFRHTIKLNGLPQLTAGRSRRLGVTPRATVLAGSRSAREMREHPGTPTRLELEKSRSARGLNFAPVADREQGGHGQRRLHGARHDTSGENKAVAMLVRSEYTGVARDLMEWAVAPQGYSKELQALQKMQTGFDIDRMRTAELMAHIITKHKSTKEFEPPDSGGHGFWATNGRWKPTPFIACIRRYAWKDAAKLLKWSLVGVESRRVLKRPGRYDRKNCVVGQTERQDRQSYGRPDYSVDTDQNLNTALHHCLAPYQADISFRRGTNKSNSWHPKGTEGAVGTRERPPPEFLTALIQANPAAIGARNRNGLTPLHFALGCTTTEINASVETIIEMCEAYPEAVRVKTYTAELPLHLAAAKNAPELVLRKLVQMYPDACLHANCWGSLPIHVGLVNGMPESQIRYLVQACPSMVGELDEDGNTPLSLALTNGSPASTVMFLVQEYPDCLSIRDANGFSPLALALINQAPEATILKLIEYCPRAVLMEAGHTLELPLHIVIRLAERHRRRLDRAGSSHGGSRRGSRCRRDASHMPSGLRRTGQCWPIQHGGHGGHGDGFYVPPSRGGLPPTRQGSDAWNDGEHSRGSLGTPSMSFTPLSLATPEIGLDPGAGASASEKTTARTSSRASGITVSAGVDFAPGSLAAAGFGSSTVQHSLSSSPRPAQVTAQLRDDSKYVAAIARPISTGTEAYLERVVAALIAADQKMQQNRSPKSRKEPGIAKGRAIEAVDLHGQTPLHIACARQLPHSVIKILVAANPAAAGEQDQHGWVPLHRYINGPAYAVAEDSLLSVLSLLEACPELGGVRHAPASIEEAQRQGVQQDKLRDTALTEEMVAVGLSGKQEAVQNDTYQPQPAKNKKKVVMTSGRREAMEEAVRKPGAKVGVKSPKLVVARAHANGQQRKGNWSQGSVKLNDPADDTAAHVNEQQRKTNCLDGGVRSFEMSEPAEDTADPRKSRKDEEARLGRALTMAEGLQRLRHMQMEQQESRAIHEAMIMQMKAGKHTKTELFPYELAEKHRLGCFGFMSPVAAQMSERVSTTTFLLLIAAAFCQMLVARTSSSTLTNGPPAS